MRKRMSPPEGFIFIEDTVNADGEVVRGIASRLGIAPSTYRKWRMAGIGPTTQRHGTRVMARETAVTDWLNAQADAAEQPSHDSRPAEPRIAA